MMRPKDTKATYSSAVNHLPSMCEALGSIPEPEKGEGGGITTGLENILNSGNIQYS